MKRYRFLKFSLDTHRNILDFDGLEEIKKEIIKDLSLKYGELNFDIKLKRYKEIKKPAISVIGEHSFLLEDIFGAYVMGNFYSATTAACCLGERIFNDLILRLAQYYKTSPHYKKVYMRKAFYSWSEAIGILSDWKITDESDELWTAYDRLGKIRTDVVHYQEKEIDLQSISFEAIRLINSIIERLFSLEDNKEYFIYFEVPGELFIKKEAETIPIVKEFFLPNCVLVGPAYELSIEKDTNRWLVNDNNVYESREVSDEEFIELRNAFRETLSKKL